MTTTINLLGTRREAVSLDLLPTLPLPIRTLAARVITAARVASTSFAAWLRDVTGPVTIELCEPCHRCGAVCSRVMPGAYLCLGFMRPAAPYQCIAECEDCNALVHIDRAQRCVACGSASTSVPRLMYRDNHPSNRKPSTGGDASAARSTKGGAVRVDTTAPDRWCRCGDREHAGRCTVTACGCETFTEMRGWRPWGGAA